MTKFQKIYATILMIFILIEMTITIVLPIVKIINTGDWSSCILWVFAPALAVEARLFYDVMKHYEDIR